MTMFALKKKVEVSETDITTVIAAVTQLFRENPRNRVCAVDMFGHKAIKVRKIAIDADVRAAAKNALPYEKA